MSVAQTGTQKEKRVRALQCLTHIYTRSSRFNYASGAIAAAINNIVILLGAFIMYSKWGIILR